MAEATLTLTADTRIIARILELLESATQVPATRDEAVGAFVRSLNENCREVVQTIAGYSAQGRSVARATMVQAVSFGEAGAPDDVKLNGPIGTIGRRWREHVGTKNPFLGRRSSGDTDWTYQIDAPLANEILRELVNDADAWRDNLPQQ